MAVASFACGQLDPRFPAPQLHIPLTSDAAHLKMFEPECVLWLVRPLPSLAARQALAKSTTSSWHHWIFRTLPMSRISRKVRVSLRGPQSD